MRNIFGGKSIKSWDPSKTSKRRSERGAVKFSRLASDGCLGELGQAGIEKHRSIAVGAGGGVLLKLLAHSPLSCS